MKSTNRMVPSAGKIKKQHKRMQETQLLVDEIVKEMEQLPPAERQEIVDLLSSLFVQEKTGREREGSEGKI